GRYDLASIASTEILSIGVHKKSVIKWLNRRDLSSGAKIANLARKVMISARKSSVPDRKEAKPACKFEIRPVLMVCACALADVP
ncbi:hypothetical protein, partial [Bacillus cihuensis]|uniref:hypothetical protein n=1 Tax=Bacillus cihuensis TaxID=1208599 RepID=UPI001F3DABDE